MKRFSHESSRSWAKQLASVTLFLGIFCAFLFGLSGISKETSEKQTESLQMAISRGIARCYATEGHYPESLEYLKEHYSISFDEEDYFVDYQVLARTSSPTLLSSRNRRNAHEKKQSAFD